jgi:signal transduction histidine kinase
VTEHLARTLALSVDPADLRASIGRRVGELIGCTRTIVCYDSESHDTFTADEAASPQAAGGAVAFPANGTLSQWLRTNREALLVPHPRGAFEYLDEAERSVLLAVGARACVPIFANARLVAILLICSSEAGWRLAPEDIELVTRLAQQAGLALENAELHRLERDRLRGLHQAEQLAMAGQLAATVAHEVRNPLTAIRSAVQYVLESSSDWEHKRGLLQRILGEVDRIERTIGEVLALSRPSKSPCCWSRRTRAATGSPSSGSSRPRSCPSSGIAGRCTRSR